MCAVLLVLAHVARDVAITHNVVSRHPGRKVVKKSILKQVGICLPGLVVMLATAVYAMEEVSRTVNAAGGRGSTPRYVNISVTGLGMPVGFTSGSSYLSHSGFLHPSNDLAPSIQDSDADGLTDWQEIGGASFDPTTPTDAYAADSDRDDVPDAVEALAGTNPMDASSLLHISLFWRMNGYQTMVWQGREGRTYEVLSAATPSCLQTNPAVIAERTGGAGLGDWKAVDCMASNAASEGMAFYRVRLKEEP